MIVLPDTFTRVAPAGILTLAAVPTAVILPSCTTITASGDRRRAGAVDDARADEREVRRRRRVLCANGNDGQQAKAEKERSSPRACRVSALRKYTAAIQAAGWPCHPPGFGVDVLLPRVEHLLEPSHAIRVARGQLVSLSRIASHVEEELLRTLHRQIFQSPLRTARA